MDSSRSNEYPKDPYTLFVCPNCGFKILTTKELFPRCFRRQTSDPFSCPNCGEKTRYYDEYSIPQADGTRTYFTDNTGFRSEGD